MGIEQSQISQGNRDVPRFNPEPNYNQQKEDYQTVIKKLGILLASIEIWSARAYNSAKKLKFKEFYSSVEVNAPAQFAENQFNDFKQAFSEYTAKYGAEPQLPSDFNQDELKRFIEHYSPTSMKAKLSKLLTKLSVMYFHISDDEKPELLRRDASKGPQKGAFKSKKQGKRKRSLNKELIEGNSFGENSYDNFRKPIEIRLC